MANPRSDEIIKQAQLYADDKDGVKFDQATYLAHLNTAMKLLYDKHPAAFYVSTVVTSPPAAVLFGDDVVVLPRYADALSHYIASQVLIEGADDEYNRKLQKDHLDLFVSLSA